MSLGGSTAGKSDYRTSSYYDGICPAAFTRQVVEGVAKRAGIVYSAA
jgi:hypothetical protein